MQTVNVTDGGYLFLSSGFEPEDMVDFPADPAPQIAAGPNHLLITTSSTWQNVTVIVGYFRQRPQDLDKSSWTSIVEATRPLSVTAEADFRLADLELVPQHASDPLLPSPLVPRLYLARLAVRTADLSKSLLPGLQDYDPELSGEVHRIDLWPADRNDVDRSF